MCPIVITRVSSVHVIVSARPVSVDEPAYSVPLKSGIVAPPGVVLTLIVQTPE
jgi:hypothetical protein